jgi:hypothetical protein
MTAPRFNILTQKELTIDLSRPAMQHILSALEMWREDVWVGQDGPQVEVEIDNFRNTLLNLLERSEPKTENSDLIGD